VAGRWEPVSASGEEMAAAGRDLARALADEVTSVTCWKGTTKSGTHAEPGQSPGAGAAAALQLEGTSPMMYDLALPAIIPAMIIIVLAVVYLASKDPARRNRAWKLLKLLLRH
jgi:7-keto-8-aminopelargonate synthetase-like enzyme